jgi:alpha-L-rhamnosidase
VDAAYRSPYGEVRSAWRYDGGSWLWKFTVPANTTALVTVPGGEAKEYPAGTYEVSAALE